MTETTQIGFDLLSYIHDSRQTYGLRSQDYTRYRRFCAHRLQRVRKSVKLSQGTGTTFKRKEVTAENARTAEHLEVLVLEAGAGVGLKSQLHFQQEEYEAALDCAVFSRAVSLRLAQAGTSQQHALAHAMMATLDPIVRLSAYRVRVPGAQQKPPGEVAQEWYEQQMVGKPERAASNVPGYAEIAQKLAAFGSDEPANDQYESACSAQLAWRGGSIGFASSELAGALAKAEKALAAENAVAMYRVVERAAQRLHVESAQAAAKVQSPVADALASAYLAVQLHAVCVQHALVLAKYRKQINLLIPRLPLFSPAVGAWITETPAAEAKPGLLGKIAGMPDGAQVVVLCDLIRKTLARLQGLVAGILARMAPGAVRLISGSQISDEISAAQAYYNAVRGYYAAAQHASAEHTAYVDALALLDSVVSQEIPQALQLITSVSGQEPADCLWSAQVGVAAADVQKLESDAAQALQVVRGLCADGKSSSVAAKEWVADPSKCPAMAANALAGRAGAPARVPQLVDLDAVSFAAVPVKPLFYDLAAASIDFDLDAIEAKAGRQSKGKLSSLIGGLWGGR
ncbi:hypothetical protein DL89DRAFT_255056 [Linderina pennispora]|uniref:Signal recognition particle subunit SRP68 n=1 Tax=Linderina pennispora TaxID=61395 RepID=A0A1Y1WHA7_9FUNG|nr:uncharacterized protein DL89DRAFT_255056 [Linderina pennispora]ORX72887.1 hypothetical protein DL89DRAFT_255056 [Linderina pennispora]